jgi:hypothetical protein
MHYFIQNENEYVGFDGDTLKFDIRNSLNGEGECSLKDIYTSIDDIEIKEFKEDIKYVYIVSSNSWDVTIVNGGIFRFATGLKNGETYVIQLLVHDVLSHLNMHSNVREQRYKKITFVFSERSRLEEHELSSFLKIDGDVVVFDTSGCGRECRIPLKKLEEAIVKHKNN